MSEDGRPAEDPGGARCPFCGAPAVVVHVHGHGQCAACGANLEPCCTGASVRDEAGAQNHVATGAGPDLFAVVFEGLGGRKATVTTEALEFALAQRLGSDLDDARLVIEAGERVGVLQRIGERLHRLRRA